MNIKNIWLRRAVTSAVCAGVLLLVGLAMMPLERPAWHDVRSHQPELNLNKLEGAMGQGLVIGLLGGFRTIIADLVFIRANVTWEKKEREKTEAYINLTTAIDPRPMFFWQNGARMMSYDIPIWRIKEAGGLDAVPESIQRRIYEEQGQRGLDFMEAARQYHPNDHRIPLEKAQIYNNKMLDYEKAAEYYLKASEMEGGPYYAARIHAELLRKLGRPQEAYASYRKQFTDAPDDDQFALKPVLLERIREMEEELNIAAADKFPAQPGEYQLYEAGGYSPGFLQQTPMSVEQAPVIPQPHDHDHDHAGHSH